MGFKINGTIDKGFFLVDGEWTCYRRNHFSCTVSYALSDPRPKGPLRYVDGRTREEFSVYGFAVSISAVTAGDDQYAIPLLQHIRACDDEGIAQQPGIVVGIVRLAPRREHAFERLQFKQATANNGKRRAAQQYYQLVVALWADVGPQNETGFVKIAQRKSANLIVRGRSPGNYQSKRDE
jgi:meiosis-specific transcription factor NDT80